MRKTPDEDSWVLGKSHAVIRVNGMILAGVLSLIMIWLPALVVEAAESQEPEKAFVRTPERTSGQRPAPERRPVQRPPAQPGPDATPSVWSRPVETPTLGTGDLYALVVGISKYQNPEVPQLQLSHVDAKDFADFLKSQKKVFKKVHLKLLVNEEATKKVLEKHLGYELLKAGKDDSVIVFFSGHGSGDPKKPGDYFFLTHDSDPHYLEATAVKMSGLNFLGGLEAKRVLLVADACHGAGFSQTRIKAMETGLSGFVARFKESSGNVILTSSRPDQYSQEKAALKNSVFTHYLLQALKGEADSDRDGVVSLSEAYQYVYDRTRIETGGAQCPQLYGRIVGSFPLAVLGSLKNPIRLEVWFVAQDSRCNNPACTDPPDYATVCSDPLCKDVTIEEGSTMYSGQNYQIAVRPSSTSYVYVYHIGPRGDIHRLFPGTTYMAQGSRTDNPLKGGEIHWIPAKDRWLRQDDQTGEEKIYVVASRSRNAILEDLYSHLQRIGKDDREESSRRDLQNEMQEYLEKNMAPTKAFVRKVEHRDVDRIDDQKIRSFEIFSRIFESPGLDAVKSVSFWHRRR